MAKYLDQTGLKYFWGKIKSLVSSQVATAVSNAKRGQALRGYAANISVSGGYKAVYPALTQAVDKDSAFVTYAGGKITVQKAGVYHIDMSTLWETNATNKILWMGVSRNGTSTLNAETSTSLLIPNATYSPALAFSTNIALEPGETLAPLLMSNIGGATCKELRINVTFNGKAGG